MNILKLFKINSITYLYFLLCFLTGYIKEPIMIFSIIMLHEIGHLFISIIFRYRILKVELFPFGGITTTDRRINIPINHELLLYSGGILNQLLIIFIIYIFKINISMKFQLLNIYILIFNLLPIYPLDGFFIIKLFIEKRFPYYKSILIAKKLSYIFLLIFIILSVYFKNIQIIIIIFLIYKNFTYNKEYKKIYHRFILERSILVSPYKKIKYENKPNLKMLKRDYYHYFYNNNKVISESKLLAKKFDINTSFW